MRKKTLLILMAVFGMPFGGCLFGCAGVKIDITPSKTSIESVPEGGGSLVINHPEGSGLHIEVDLISGVANTAGALLTAFGNPLEWFIGSTSTDGP